MNKSNKILLGVLSFVVVCVIGYALFSETITITGTATAQGTFDIVPGCQTGIDSRIGTTTSLGWSKEGGYINDSCNVSGNTISMDVEFLYPYAQRYFTISFMNNGTIDAKIDLKKTVETEELCISDDANGTNKRCVDGKKLEGFYANYGTMFATSYKQKGVLLEDASGNIITLEEAVSNGMFDSTNQIVYLNSGYSVYITYYSEIRLDIDNPNTSNKMYIDLNNSIDFIIEQVTFNDN